MPSSAPEIVIHRVNQRDKLHAIPHHFGAEIDLRADGSNIILNHDPFVGGERFEDWLDCYRHGLLVLNIKEAGIESAAIKAVEQRGIRRFFLLDVEFPYLYRASRMGERRIAIRYSEDEPISSVDLYRSRLDWVWIDTNTRLPLDENTVSKLSGINSCLVCPERWGRPQDIEPYRRQMASLGFRPQAVMTALSCAERWVGPLS